MADGGFDPNDPNSFQMNEYVVPPDDDPSEDLSHTAITQNDHGFSGGSQQETSFLTPKGSQESRWIEIYRDMFKNKYGIDDQAFNVLRLDLERRGGNLQCILRRYTDKS